LLIGRQRCKPITGETTYTLFWRDNRRLPQENAIKPPDQLRA
jgi:hypothetical protein